LNERSGSRLLGTSSDGFLCELWRTLGFHKMDSFFFSAAELPCNCS